MGNRERLLRQIYAVPPNIDAERLARPLALAPPAHDELVRALRAYLAEGARGAFQPPATLELSAHSVRRLHLALGGALAPAAPPQPPPRRQPTGHRMPTAAERVAQLAEGEETRSGQRSTPADALLERAQKKAPAWKRRGWVGPGGARATAERQGARAGHGPDSAYTNAIYARMTGRKSVGPTTRAGRPIAHRADALYRAVGAWDAHAAPAVAHRAAAEHLLRALPGWSAADHADAAAHHALAGARSIARAHARAALVAGPFRQA